MTSRRVFLKGTAAAGIVAVAAGAGLLKPGRVLAAQWPQAAFDAKALQEVTGKLYGGMKAVESKDIVIKAPLQAENGAVVPFSVSTSIPNVQSIGVVVEKNSTPLIATADFGEGASGFFAARMKMAKTSDVRVYVKAGDKLYTAAQQVKVTVGGCGG